MTRYFVFCPYFRTGGPEALHQLCGSLRDLNQEAWLWYTDSLCNNQEDRDIIPEYSHYNVKLSPLHDLESIDHSDCVWILPEGMPPDFYQQKRKAQIAVWYLATVSGNPNAIAYQTPALKSALLLAQSDFGYEEIKRACPKHPNIFRLTDYTRESLLHKDEQLRQESRIAQVVFNPSKGIQHTQQIRRFLPDIRFVPVRNMDLAMLKDLGLKSSLYIDFGHHPGKDRLPRELASLGSNVITGDEGVAASNIDLPIGRWKMRRRDGVIYDYSYIANKIRFALADQRNIFDELSAYRSVIRNEKQTFFSEVQAFIDATLK